MSRLIEKYRNLSRDVRAAIFLCLGMFGLSIISSYIGKSVSENDIYILVLLAGLIALIILAYRIGRKFNRFDSSRYARMVGLISLAVFVGLLIFMVVFITSPSASEQATHGYTGLDFLIDTLNLAVIFLLGFAPALASRLLHSDRNIFVQLWHGFRAIEKHLFSRPLVILRIFSVILIVILIGSVWSGISTMNRLSAIERTLGGRQALGCDPQETIDRVEPSIVRIIGGFGEGSGFVVADHYLITNQHVIDKEPSPKIVYTDGSFENGVVVAADADKDLALIRIEKDIEPLQWADWGSLQIGQTLLLFGYAYGGQLNGQATVNHATISAFRGKNDDVARYVQTDGGLISGMSGGPMMTLCGRVAAVNEAGGQSMGAGIDAGTARDWAYSTLVSKPTKAWQDQETIDPDASPVDAVKAYYAYISARNYEAAYAMLAPHFIGDVSYDDWAAGFETQLQTAVYSVKADPNNHWRVFVEIESTDLVEGEIQYRDFAGSWLVQEINGHLRLWESNIKDVTEE